MTIAKGEITIIEVYDGADGTPSYTHIRYSANSNGNPMTETPQPTTNYIGLYVSSSATAPSTYGTYSWTKIKGETGTSGTSRYTHIAYSANSNGNPMTPSPQSTTKYIGFAVTTSSTAPSGYSSYTWSLIKGDKGDTGKSLTEVISHWFATPLSSGVTHSAAWSTTPVSYSAAEPYLWRYEKFLWDDDPNDFTRSDPYIIGQYSKDGADGATAWTTTTAPAAPNYTFTKSNLNGPAGHTQKAGDLIFYRYYRYRISTVASTTVLATDRVSIRGAAGAAGAAGTDGQSAYEAAVAGGYTGTQTQFYTDLGLMQDLPETLESINDALDSYGTDIASILADKTISPPERIELRSTLLNVQRESAELYAKLDGEGVVAQALSAAASALTNALEEIVSAEGYSAIDFEALVDLFDDYASAVVNARNAVSVLTEEKFSDLTAGQVLLGSRIGKYEERLILEPDEITMTIDTDSGLQPVMTLSQDELAFYSEGQKVSYFANQRMMIENALVIQQLEVGNHVIEKYGSKFTIFRWVGE